MARLKIPRGLYLQARLRAGDGAVVFRWGHAPGLRARGIRPLDLFADGRPLTAADLAAHGLPPEAAPPARDGRALLHDGRTRPLPAADAIEAARQLTAALQAAPAAGTAPRRAPRPAAATGLTVGELIEAFLAPGNERFENRADDTLRAYRSWRPPVDEVFGHEPCTGMTEDLIEDWFALMRQARGHRMAYGAYQLLRAAWNWGRRRYRLHEIIWISIETPKPKAKLRVGTEAELAALIEAADNPAGLARRVGINDPDAIPPARPELGDSLVLAIWTVQRARDVLTYSSQTLRSGRFRFIASKNGTRMDIPVVGTVLPARLEAMAARRAARGARCDRLVLDPERDQPYLQKTHGKHFRQARALAAHAVPSLAGEGVDDWGQLYTPFTFEDCRDTGITRLLRAGCSIEEVASWSNHKDINALRALAPSYMDLTGEVADAAGGKLAAYAGQKGFRL